jgi:hypothetical protein
MNRPGLPEALGRESRCHIYAVRGSVILIFGFVETVDCLGQSVVVAVANTANRRLDTGLGRRSVYLIPQGTRLRRDGGVTRPRELKPRRQKSDAHRASGGTPQAESPLAAITIRLTLSRGRRDKAVERRARAASA